MENLSGRFGDARTFVTRKLKTKRCTAEVNSYGMVPETLAVVLKLKNKVLKKFINGCSVLLFQRLAMRWWVNNSNCIFYLMNDYQSVRDKSVLVHAMGHKILRPFMDFREAD